VTDGAMAKEVVIAPSVVTLGMEEEPPSGGMAEEIRQTVKDA